jgi:hypothetical protein
MLALLRCCWGGVYEIHAKVNMHHKILDFSVSRVWTKSKTFFNT